MRAPRASPRGSPSPALAGSRRAIECSRADHAGVRRRARYTGRSGPPRRASKRTADHWGRARGRVTAARGERAGPLRARRLASNGLNHQPARSPRRAPGPNHDAEHDHATGREGAISACAKAFSSLPAHGRGSAMAAPARRRRRHRARSRAGPHHREPARDAPPCVLPTSTDTTIQLRDFDPRTDG